MGKLKGSTLEVSGFLDEFEKDEIKRNVDIIDLFQSYGVDLEKKGSAYMGLCPFHEDSNPSLSVDKEKGLFHCFGCGASGDIFDLVMKMQSVSFKEALSFLKTGDFSSLDNIQPVKKPKKKEPEAPVLTSISLDDIADYYHNQLAGHKEAVQYLESRNLLDWESLNRLNIGFAPGDLKTKVSDKQFDELTDIGIFTDKGREAFSGCLVFPLKDTAGKTVSFYARKISPRAKVKHLYLKGIHRGLFNSEALKVYPERIILSECVIDSLSLIVSGVQNTVPIYGTNGITNDHIQGLKENRIKEIVLAFDNDKPGKEASEKLTGSLNEEGFPVRSIVPPGGCKDWNEAITASSLDKSIIETLISAASVIMPKEKIKVEVEQGRYHFPLNGIIYRLSGVKEGFISSLKVNIKAEKEEEKHIDNVDLFSARSRSSFSLILSRLFSVESARVEKDLVTILEWLEEDRDRKLSGPLNQDEVSLTDEEKEIGLELLKAPDLFDRIESDLSALGYVGEGMNKRLMYLAASSRKLDSPISIIVISQSAAGKSYLIDTVKKLIPEEDVLSMTSLSDQALNYLPEESLLHKFLIMGEAVHSDAVDHQMREMLSAQELSRLVTTKDDKTGKMVSRLVRKKAIVSAVMSSATGDINPENASRSFVISTDESEDQTKAIHQEQRKKYSHSRFQKKSEDIPSIIKVHKAAQRLLENRVIINPFAEFLDFPAALMRSRRDHERFIDLIASVCFLRQFQKEEQEKDGYSYIECDLVDYEIAYRIMVSILPSTLSNFPRSAQILYESLRTLVRDKAESESLSFNEVSLTQREIREKTGLSHDVVKWNLRHLVEYEYVRKIGGVKRGMSGRYRIDQDEDISALLSEGILSPEELIKRMEEKPG